jgi:hypothetical protein
MTPIVMRVAVEQNRPELNVWQIESKLKEIHQTLRLGKSVHTVGGPPQDLLAGQTEREPIVFMPPHVPC